MQCVCVCTCACAECRGVYKKCYFDILIHKRWKLVEEISTFTSWTPWNNRVSYWNRQLCLSRKVVHGKSKSDTLKNRCGIVWVETVKMRWLAMKLKVAHMDAGGRKWCAQRQQSRTIRILGSKLSIKHKKEAIFQSLRCLGEKIRTSALLNPMKSIRRPANPCATRLCGTFTRG